MSSHYSESLYGEDFGRFRAIARVIGLREITRSRPTWRTQLRFRRFSISFRWQCGLAYSVYHDEAHWYAGFGPIGVYIDAPMLITQREGSENWNAHYGFSLFEGDLHLNWRTHTKIVRAPWRYDWQRSEILTFDRRRPVWTETRVERSAEKWDARQRKREAAEASVSETFKYRYMLRSGEVQVVDASVHVCRMEWRRFRLPFWRRVRTYIDVRFSGEVGDGTGSWKGGTIGCSYDLRRHEEPEHALRRMEQERRFDR